MLRKGLLSIKAAKDVFKMSTRFVNHQASSIVQDVKDKRYKAMLGGGEKKIAAQHKKVCLVATKNSKSYFCVKQNLKHLLYYSKF